MKKVGFYIRVSTEEQAENPEGSIKNQEERLKKALDLKSCDGPWGKLESVYCDPARSGKDTKRPELQRLLKDIRLGKIDVVMVTELSRISRSIKDFSDIWELFKKHSCEFLSLRENFDTSTASGELVLFITANLAQFERRQVSERVSANVNERASRGLYNGGCIALGLKRDPDRPGYLLIDDEAAPTIQKCFEVFLRERSLSVAAKWLNDHGFSPKRRIEGGGLHQRLKHFTVDNLQHILKNKIYKGVQIYRSRGVIHEAKAVWPALVDELTFERVQKKLKHNLGRAKPIRNHKMPYLLSGISFCATCKDHMPGKSAHGNSGKVAYYEHSWQTKKNSTLSKKIFDCKPTRVPAKLLEELVMSKVTSLLSDERFVSAILAKAQETLSDNTTLKEFERCRNRVYGLNSQIEALAERIANLPAGVPPEPLYKQLTKIHDLKYQEESRLPALKAQSNTKDESIALREYKSLQQSLLHLMAENSNPEIKKAIIQRLIHRVEIGPDFVEIKYIVGKAELSLAQMDLTAASKEGASGSFQKNLCEGSQSLTNGAPGRT